VAGLALAGRVLSDMTGKALELRDAFSPARSRLAT
jgi:hypothetical protein